MSSKARSYRRRTGRVLKKFRIVSGIEGGSIAYEKGGLTVRDARLQGVELGSPPPPTIIREWRPPSK